MKNKNLGYRAAAHIVMLAVTLCIILPFLLLTISSFTDEGALLRNGYSFFPEKFSLDAYKFIFQSGDKIIRSYVMSFVITIVGTIISISITALFAYPLSLKNLPFKGVITFFVFFTMLFNGGLVPSYILWSTYLGVKDTIWGQLLPNMLVNAFNILLIRTYFSSSIPDTLIEAAQIDGAGQVRTFWSIIIPLGKPILVTVGTFTAINYWNNWTNGLYFISKKTELFTIQNLLDRMVKDLQFLTSSTNLGSNAAEAISRIPTTGVQMAIAFVAVLPILVLFPFLQKYYAKGIAMGAVKG